MTTTNHDDDDHRMAEYETWVPLWKSAIYSIPRPLRLIGLAGGIGTWVYYAKETAQEALFYIAIVVLVNLALYRAELWTAARDRAAISAGVPTPGWGVAPGSMFARIALDRKVQSMHKAS